MSRASSSSRAKSAEDLASRETSSPKIAPASPRQTFATTWRNPSRSAPNRPEAPRSASITATFERAQPSLTASSARPYCRIVDSVFSLTCTSVDCRR
ncbi:hypothetical protein A6P39_001695 [Streptomyces sp. FXJ1.172]|nr:hypothetical protein [Streptomyces sp. FXJ1.172]WEO92914.1 hypothetical protein A6P39_001695 [Streptomyces sp. FXJ1.172]